MTRLLPTLPLRAAALLLLLCGASAWAKPPVHAPVAHAKTAPAPAPTPAPTLRLGEISTYKRKPDFSVPYRRGWELARDQLNAAGGLLGRKIEVLSRDDNGSADDAVKAAQGLVEKDKVLAIFGGYSSESGLALAHYADQNKILYLAVAPLSQRLTWQEGNPYTFRLRPGAWMQAAAVAPKALGVRKLHWALIYEDTDSGRSTADAFKGLVKAFQSKTEFVSEQAISMTPGRFDAVAAVKAMAAAKPDAIFNMLTGAALDQWVHEGVAQQLFDQRPVVSLFTGDPENIGTLGADLPEGWIITGYPRDAIDTPANQEFVAAYRERYNEAPGTASLLGYTSMMSLAAGFKRAGVADGEKLAQAFPGLKLPTPFGEIEYRTVDHQSTLGTYLGYTAIADGKPVMDNFVYASGARLQPLDEQIHRMRTAEAGRSGSASTRTGDAGKAIVSAKPPKPARPGAPATPDLQNPPSALPDWPGGIAPESAPEPDAQAPAPVVQAPEAAPTQAATQAATQTPAQAAKRAPTPAPKPAPAQAPTRAPTQTP
jgi:branched-chain amino acid transport system substrate-binding protein